MLGEVFTQYNKIHPEAQTGFEDLELEGVRVIEQLHSLGILNKLEQRNLIEPSLRCANVAAQAAVHINDVARKAGIKDVVSPRVTFCTGFLFKAGQAIDDELVELYGLDKLDPVDLGLYKYPAYARERTTQTSNVLKLALLLHQLNSPWYAQAVLHGPHPQFFERAELPAVLAMLANANLAHDETGIWHSYLHPGVGLLAIPPYATRSDELAPTEAKDWVDRARVVAINTTLQHVLRMYAGVEFTDETFSHIADEGLQRWNVVKEVFKQIGLGLPSPEDLVRQKQKTQLLKKWMQEYNIVERLKLTQQKSGHLLHDHSFLVSQLMGHLAQELNRLAVKYDGQPIVDQEYLELIGYAHDSIKSFSPDEIAPLLNLKGYGTEFMYTYPPEVAARDNVSLSFSHDAQLFAFLRWYENQQQTSDDGASASIANDFLSGPYHMFSLISGLLSYSDLAVISKDSNGCHFKPDITERFLDTNLRYISDPHTAIMSYAKLMTLAATLSWYLGLSVPKEGSTVISPDNLTQMTPNPIDSALQARKHLEQITRVFQIFGIAVPNELRNIRKRVEEI